MSGNEQFRFLLGIILAWSLGEKSANGLENLVSFLDLFQHRLVINSTNNNYPASTNSRQIDYFCKSYPLFTVSIKDRILGNWRFIGTQNGNIIVPSSSEEITPTESTIPTEEGLKRQNKIWQISSSWDQHKFPKNVNDNVNKSVFTFPVIIIINQSINTLASSHFLLPGQQSFEFSQVNLLQENTLEVETTKFGALDLSNIINEHKPTILFLVTLLDKNNGGGSYRSKHPENSAAGISGPEMCAFPEKHLTSILQTAFAFLSIIDLTVTANSQNSIYLAPKNTLENISKFAVECSGQGPNDPEFARILEQLNAKGHLQKVAQNLSLNNLQIAPDYLANLTKCMNYTVFTLSKTSPLFIHNSDVKTGTFDVKMNSIAAVIIAIVVIACSIATIVGNALVVIAFYMEKKLQITNNYFLVSLSIADGCVGLVSVNIWLMLYLGEGKWPLGWPACVTWIFFDYVWCTTSIYHVFIISIDRCWSVSFPTSYHNRSGNKAAMCMIIPTWTVSVCYWLVVIVGHPLVFGRFVPDGFCRANYAGQLFLTYASTSITYWVPLIVITILYIHIYKVAKNLKKKKMLQKANSAHARRPHTADRSRKRSPSSPNVITAPDGTLEFVHIERGTKTRDGSVESNNLAFPESEMGKKVGSTCREMRPDGGQDSGIEEENDSDPAKNNQHTQTSHGCIPNKEEDGRPIGRSGSSKSGRTNFDQESNRFNRRLHTLQAPVGMSNACSTPEIVVTASKEDQKVPAKNTLAPFDSVRLSIQTPSRKNSFMMSSQQKLNAQLKTNDRKAMKTLTFLLGAFIFCWTPWNIAEIINGLWGPTTVNYNLYQFTWLLTYINSGLNPLCYAFANAVFKDTFIRILSLGRINPQNQKNLRGIRN